MTSSVRRKEIEDLAQGYDSKLLATDGRFRYEVQIQHEDGSEYKLKNAFLIEYMEYLLCFTEHHGFFVFEKDDLDSYVQHSVETVYRLCKIPIGNILSDQNESNDS